VSRPAAIFSTIHGESERSPLSRRLCVAVDSPGALRIRHSFPAIRRKRAFVAKTLGSGRLTAASAELLFGFEVRVSLVQFFMYCRG
jgi:hypothetical protein